jgi:hypothetical protein
MKDKVVNKILKSFDIPELVYQWDIADLKDEFFLAALKETIPDVLDFVQKRKHLIFEEDDDSLLVSRISVFILRYMLRKDYTKVGYLTPTKLATLKAESWEGGEEYGRYQKMDLIVLDKVFLVDLDKFKLSTLWEFFEFRLMSRRSTIIVSDVRFTNLIPPRVKSVLSESETKRIKRPKC